MPTIMPQSELVRKAIAYLNEEHKRDPHKSLSSCWTKRACVSTLRLWTRKLWNFFSARSRNATNIPLFFFASAS